MKKDRLNEHLIAPTADQDAVAAANDREELTNDRNARKLPAPADSDQPAAYKLDTPKAGEFGLGMLVLALHEQRLLEEK